MDNITRLTQYLSQLAGDGLCIAFSGGVDSALLLKVVCLVGKPHAVTLCSPFHPLAEGTAAADMATSFGAVYTAITVEDMPSQVMENPPDRCYHCKKTLFQEIQAYAASQNLRWVLDGTNADDLNQYRPGLKALAELGIKSPLAELGFDKAQVRQMAAQLGLTVASKPSAPCLATRFPYNQHIDLAVLGRVELLEDRIKSLGPKILRARVHGDTVRLEVPPADFGVITAHQEQIVQWGTEAGFACITLDLAGYRSGSMDRLYFGEEKV